MQDDRRVMVRLGSAMGKSESMPELVDDIPAIRKLRDLERWEKDRTDILVTVQKMSAMLSANSIPPPHKLVIPHPDLLEIAERSGMSYERVEQEFLRAGFEVVRDDDNGGVSLRGSTVEIVLRSQDLTQATVAYTPNIQHRMKRQSKGDKHRNRRNRWEKG